MCYSPEADLIAGLVVGAVAVDGFRHVERRSDLALASVPAVLAAHQLIEAAAWWGLQGRIPSDVGEAAVTAYLAVALGVVPILVPFAVMRAEENARRRSAMVPFVGLGAAVSAMLFASMLAEPVGAAIGGRYLAYDVAIIGGSITGLGYVGATCVPLLMSTRRVLRGFGIVNIPVAAGLSILLAAGFISLWCVWAAVTSVVVAVSVRRPYALHRLSAHATSAG